MVDKKSVLSNTPAVLAATGGFITAIVGLLTFMSGSAPSIGAFDASPNIIAIGESSVLKWSVTGDGATVTIDPDIGSVALSGTRVVAPGITTNYTLTAENKDQEKIASVQIVVKEKNETSQMINEAPGGVAAKSEVSMPLEVSQPPAEEQSVIEETFPEARETANPGKSTIVMQVDSQQNAIAQPAPAVVKAETLSSYSAANQPEMEQSAIVAPVVAIVPDTAKANDVPGPLVPDASGTESNSSPPDDHIEYSQSQPGAISGVPESVAQNNESSDEVNFPSDTVSVGTVSEQKSVKRITAEDWDSLNNESSSSEDFESNAPIYAKIGGTSNTPGISLDLQDPAVSDQGFDDSEYLGNDMQDQDSSMADTHLPGTS